MDREKEIEEMARDIGDVLAVTHEGDSFPFTMHTRSYLSKSLIKAGYRKADEVRKEMCGETERLEAALDDAIHSFTRMETLYKIKRFKSETETAKKIFTEWYHDVKARSEDAEYIKEKAWKEYGVEVDE